MIEKEDLSPLEVVQKRREARKAAIAKEYDAQRAKDLEALDALEVEHGDSSVASLDVPFTPGLPTLIACRVPDAKEMKRYRDRVKPKKDGKGGDAQLAAEEIAAVCRIYPDRETYDAILEARPGVHVQLGVAAIGLAVANTEEESKS